MKNLQCREHLEHLSEIYRITDAWRDLGFEGQPAISCRCPWREDRKPSFSVFDDGRAFHPGVYLAVYDSFTKEQKSRIYTKNGFWALEV